MLHRDIEFGVIQRLLLWLAVLVLAGGCQTAAAPDTGPAEVQSKPTAVVVVPSRTPPPTSTVAPSPSAAPTATTAAEAQPAIDETTATAEPVAAAEPAAAPAAPQPPSRLVIPDLKLDAPVVPMGWRVVETASGAVSEWVIPEDEAGHHINSAALGEPGNLVISGHNNIFGRVFEPISLAWKNDSRVVVDKFTDRSDVLNGREVQLFGADGSRVDYQIEEFYRLKDTGVPVQQRVNNARFMLPTEDDRVTIITCWPPWNNTHRLVLIARPAAQ